MITWSTLRRADPVDGVAHAVAHGLHVRQEVLLGGDPALADAHPAGVIGHARRAQQFAFRLHRRVRGRHREADAEAVAV